MTNPPLTFAAPEYPGGRILLMLGQVEIGAIFQPAKDPAYGGIWHHGFWLGNAAPNGLGARQDRTGCEERASG